MEICIMYHNHYVVKLQCLLLPWIRHLPMGGDMERDRDDLPDLLEEWDNIG